MRYALLCLSVSVMVIDEYFLFIQIIKRNEEEIHYIQYLHYTRINFTSVQDAEQLLFYQKYCQMIYFIQTGTWL